MRLRQVLTALGPGWDAQADLLNGRLAKAGVRCVRETARSVEMRVEEKTEAVRTAAADTVVLTDDRALAAALAQSGTVCVGCARTDDGYFDGAAMVTDDPACLDAIVLEELLLRTRGEPVEIARTERLVIREIAEQDIETLHRISRQEGMQYLQGTMRGRREEAAVSGKEGMPEEDGAEEDCFAPDRLLAYVKYAYRLYGYGLWSVFRRDGTLIGCCGLVRMDEVPGVETSGDEGGFELQYVVAREHQRKGYGTEMCRAALRYGVLRLGMKQAWIRTKRPNLASRRLALRLGFSLVCTDRSGVMYFRKNAAVQGPDETNRDCTKNGTIVY